MVMEDLVKFASSLPSNEIILEQGSAFDTKTLEYTVKTEYEITLDLMQRMHVYSSYSGDYPGPSYSSHVEHLTQRML